MSENQNTIVVHGETSSLEQQITVGPHQLTADEAVQAGAQDYLVKSQLTPGWLERSIRNAIERHRLDMALLSAEEKYHGIFDKHKFCQTEFIIFA